MKALKYSAELHFFFKNLIFGETTLHMKRLLSLLAGMLSALALINAAESQTYLFRMLDTGSGLPDNNVRNMTMLPNGMMCIQTSSMLNFYDGTSCRSYKYNAVEIPYTEYSGQSATYYDAADDIIWCTTRDNIWVFDMKTREFEYDITGRLEKMGVTGAVKNLVIDNDGRYWFFTEDGKVLICDRKGPAVTKVLPKGMTLPIEMKHHEDKVWMMSMNGTLAGYDMQLEDFRTVQNIPTVTSVESSSRMAMDITSEGDIWLMYDKDLVRYDAEQETFSNVSSLPPHSRDLYTTIAIDGRDDVWVGTARSGVSIISDNGFKTQSLPYLELIDGKRIYHHTDISKIYTDDRNGVWIATLSEGLLYWNKDIIRLNTINNSSISKGDMNDESVKCMVEDDNGNIYVGTIHGLLLYNPKTQEVTVPHKELKDELCISLYKDSMGRIWVGTFYNGAFCIHGSGVTHFKYQDISVDMSYQEAKPNFNCVRSFYEDSKGRFWISVYGGVGRFDPATGFITLLREGHPGLERFMIVRDMCEDPDGRLYICGDNGRFIYSIDDDLVLTDLNSEESHIQTSQVLLDNRSLLWTATTEGVGILDLNCGRRYQIGSKDGLPAGYIMSIAEDGTGNIWVASFSHISRIRPSIDADGKYTFAVSTYGKDDGVEAGAFFQKSAIRHSNGHIYFGGAHGICEVVPQNLYQDRSYIAPLITRINVAGEDLDTWGEKLTLKHDESFLTFEFSNLNYANPSHTTYTYKLENFDMEWRKVNPAGPGFAQYTYLEPGSYRFLVKAANNDTDWGETASIDIVIRPPFYRSIMAYIIYICIFLAIVAAFIYWQLLRTKQKIQENKEKEKVRQREKLDQMKFKFFTNVSHELRTPLSLIILPLESIMKEMKDSPLMPKLQTMHNNASQLLSMVNHLLDFRKLEMGGEKLNLTSGNISEFVNSIVLSFNDAAQRNSIILSFEDTLEHPMMVFDSMQMHKIVNNLLSNALKFTPEGGFINVSLSQTEDRVMHLSVSDTGIGIPAKDIGKVFDRFYRSGNTELRAGSGIGLSIVKQYVEMHSGSIEVQSEIGKGTTFTVHVPMTLSPDGNEEAAVELQTEEAVAETAGKAEGKPHVMVVDDNPDFREYLVGELSEFYNVTSAADGRQCLDMLKTSNAEIIICDVMMPNMDGFEVVKAIKNNIETSHIPVILLSARTSEDVRLEGYETGADAYLTKPFKLDILLARVRNLIEERKRRIDSIAKGAEISPSEVTITTIDQKLMTRIMQSIEKNMDNSEYSVEELSSDVGMHRMNLYRKLQSIAGMTPSEFIRTMRLKRAAQLLRDDPNLTVAEVSDMVGFNTPKYFTKYFKEMFGVTPSQYR